MTTTMLSVQKLGKMYRLRRARPERYVTLRDAMSGAAAGTVRWLNRRDEAPPATEEFWALRDVSFEVTRGEVVGIIGRNGAGKSTLLKILSRITEPTAGRAVLSGRVASLLEVGTGFHPELTGRENIFLNGAILGMTRTEIVRKFDAIVEFAGVAQFLETPVKRYSSGMYVRLAFAVAAHLEPDVLIVDEVLAVGDLEFQQKSLGKMHEVSCSGRTVLFVSHNMAAINALTRRTLLLDRGEVAFDGATSEAVARYSDLAVRAQAGAVSGGGTHASVQSVTVIDAAGAPGAQYVPGTPLRLVVIVETDGSPRLSIEAFLVDAMQQKLAMASLHQFEGVTLPHQAGRYRVVMELAPGWLASGTYSIDVTTSIVNSTWDHYVDDAATIEVIASNPGRGSWDFRHDYGYGAFAMPCVRPPDITPAGDGE